MTPSDRTRSFPARVATGPKYALAEGPVWDPIRQRVLWVDIRGGGVHFGRLVQGPDGDRIEPTGSLTFAETVGAAVCAPDGALLVAGARDLHRIPAGRVPDGSTGADVVVSSNESIPTVDGDHPVIPILAAGVDSRLNDGGCDPLGRFLIGSMSLDGRTGGEVLCRLLDDGTIETLDADLTLSNGLAWSPDGRTMYSIDTEPGVVHARSFDPATGAVGERRDLFRPEGGNPDGMCVDVEGNLWIAIWGAGQVRCYAPTPDPASGVVLAVVEVAAPHTSSVAFVGPALDLLMITTAGVELTAEQLAAAPDSGRLFTARVGTSGAPVPLWSGRLG